MRQKSKKVRKKSLKKSLFQLVKFRRFRQKQVFRLSPGPRAPGGDPGPGGSAGPKNPGKRRLDGLKTVDMARYDPTGCGKSRKKVRKKSLKKSLFHLVTFRRFRQKQVFRLSPGPLATCRDQGPGGSAGPKNPGK